MTQDPDKFLKEQAIRKEQHKNLDYLLLRYNELSRELHVGTAIECGCGKCGNVFDIEKDGVIVDTGAHIEGCENEGMPTYKQELKYQYAEYIAMCLNIVPLLLRKIDEQFGEF
jgi:hypothetical protein